MRHQLPNTRNHLQDLKVDGRAPTSVIKLELFLATLSSPSLIILLKLGNTLVRLPLKLRPEVSPITTYVLSYWPRNLHDQEVIALLQLDRECELAIVIDRDRSISCHSTQCNWDKSVSEASVDLSHAHYLRLSQVAEDEIHDTGGGQVEYQLAPHSIDLDAKSALKVHLHWQHLFF